MRDKKRTYYMSVNGKALILEDVHTDSKARIAAKEYAKKESTDSIYQIFSISPINSNTRYIDI